MQNVPTNIPANYFSSSPPPIPKKDRGVLLTVLLGFATLWNVIATFGVVMGGAAIDQATQNGGAFADQSVHHVASRLVLVLAVFQVAQLISVLGMWAWKRWALMGYFVTSIFAIFGVIKMTGETPTWSMVWLGIVLVSVFPRLAMFED